MESTMLARPLSTIEYEINSHKENIVMDIISIGKRLVEAKAQLQHGEWLPWLEEKVSFADRTASKYMKLAKEYGDIQIGSHMPISKLQILLSVPKEKREKFVKDNNVENVSVKELQSIINMNNGSVIDGEVTSKTIESDKPIEIKDDESLDDDALTSGNIDIVSNENDINTDPVKEVAPVEPEDEDNNIDKVDTVEQEAPTPTPIIESSPVDTLQDYIGDMLSKCSSIKPTINSAMFESPEQKVYNLSQLNDLKMEIAELIRLAKGDNRGRPAGSPNKNKVDVDILSNEIITLDDEADNNLDLLDLDILASEAEPL